MTVQWPTPLAHADAVRALDALDSHIAIIDVAGTVVWTNRAWRHFSEHNGGAADAYLGWSYLDQCVHVEGASAEGAPSVASGLREVLDGQLESFDHQYPCHSPEEERWFRLQATRFGTGDRAHVVIAHNPITAAKQAERMMRKAKEAAEDADRIKTVVLNGISHEMRTPLNAVVGFTQIMADDPSLPTGLQRHARQVLEGSARLSELIEDVIAIAQNEGRGTELNDSEFDLHDLVERAVSVFGPACERKGVGLQLEIAPGTPQWVISDFSRMRQALLHMVSNAVKFTEEGRVDVAVSAEPAGTQPAEDPWRIRVVVNDTGCGIVPEATEQIFEPFEQLGARQPSPRGVGLGLTIARAVATAMRGRLWVEGGESAGATFVLEVLAHPSHNPVSTPSPGAIPSVQAPMRGAGNSARLPTPLVARLREAVHGGFLQDVHALLPEVEAHDPSLAATLRQLADGFDYEGLLSVLST